MRAAVSPRDPSTSRRVSVRRRAMRYSSVSAAHARAAPVAGPEAVPQRADNCVTAGDDDDETPRPTQMH